MTPWLPVIGRKRSHFFVMLSGKIEKVTLLSCNQNNYVVLYTKWINEQSADIIQKRNGVRCPTSRSLWYLLRGVKSDTLGCFMCVCRHWMPAYVSSSAFCRGRFFMLCYIAAGNSMLLGIKRIKRWYAADCSHIQTGKMTDVLPEAGENVYL